MGLSKRRKALITLATLIGTFLAALGATVVWTAMPTVIGELGGLELYPRAFASYLLAATLTGPVFGKLSDTYGRKPVYLAGIFLFLLGSVLAGTSQSMAALIFFRTIQDLFGAVLGISAVVGPAAGGFITDLISWRWVACRTPFPGVVAAWPPPR
ncbi:MAG TPA: MFS transporter [Rubrobacter sp.]